MRATGVPSTARDRVKLPKECPMCACLRPPTTNVCPNCGFEAKPVNKVLMLDGELRELDRNKRGSSIPLRSMAIQTHLQRSRLQGRLGFS